jgi:hydroxymethylpyrimidine pyrophosphatase-like HAD family hydrolase
MVAREAAANSSPRSTRPYPALGARLALAHELLRDLEELSLLLVAETRARSWLNAYIVSAGMAQIAEDRLHRDPFSSRKVAKSMRSLLGPAGKGIVGAIESGAAFAANMRGLGPSEGRLLRFRSELAVVMASLAALVAGGDHPYYHVEDLSSMAEALRLSVERLPLAARREVLKLPASFRSFDQYPEDLDWLACEFARQWPERDRRLLVVGIRTSGVYLAPLCAAYLARRGYRSLSLLTMRPTDRLMRADRQHVEDLRAHGGMALLVDDPPGSGGTMAATARRLEMLGLDTNSIILLLQLFGEADAVPEKLSRHPTVVLPFSGWHVHRLLEPEAVSRTMTGLLLDSSTVTSVEVMTGAAEPQRGHVHATFEIAGRGPGAMVWKRQLQVRGVGQGLFGEQAGYVAERMAPFLPVTYGVVDGLLYQDLPAGESRLDLRSPAAGRADAAAIADYVLARRRELAVPEDRSLRVFGRNAVWQRASDELGLGFGRSAFVARFALHRAARQLLRVQRPSVVDGNTALSRWFARPGDASALVKVGGEDQAFSNRDLYCYDAAFDLAGAAASAADTTFKEDLRRSWRNLTGESISDERWLLYQVIHLLEVGSLQGDTPELGRRLDRSMQEYLGRSVFEGLAVPRSGALCAIDIDGVLETGRLGFSATTPAGARALRALTLHGYRPVIVTGRCLGDVRDRCRHWGLAGGAAEYGAFVYDHLTGEARCLLDAAEVARVSRLADTLRSIPAVLVDEAFSGIVRGYRNDSGRITALDADTIAAALEASGSAESIRVVPGVSQTDFVPARIGKGVGLGALAEQLAQGLPPDRRVRFAMGDTVADIPMFALAQTAFTPSNGHHAARSEGVRVTTKPFAAGVHQAVAEVLGHKPGGCHLCAMRPLTPEASLVMTGLSAQDESGWGRLRKIVELDWQLRTARFAGVGTSVPAQPARPIDDAMTAG